MEAHFWQVILSLICLDAAETSILLTGMLLAIST
jgi:hypothetical protein